MEKSEKKLKGCLVNLYDAIYRLRMLIKMHELIANASNKLRNQDFWGCLQNNVLISVVITELFSIFAENKVIKTLINLLTGNKRFADLHDKAILWKGDIACYEEFRHGLAHKGTESLEGKRVDYKEILRVLASFEEYLDRIHIEIFKIKYQPSTSPNEKSLPCLKELKRILDAEVSNQENGQFSDYLNQEEVNFSKYAADILREEDWAIPMLSEDKISRSLNITSCPRDYDSLNEIKSALFEVRVALAIHNSGLSAEYEYSSAAMGNSSVDFGISTKDNDFWLIELTSLRESSAVKNATYKDNDFFSYFSISDNKSNSPEVLDILKVQNAICNKVSNNLGNPIKFPPIREKSYHMIIVDMRGFNAGIADYFDYYNIVYGSQSLLNRDNGVYCRNWIDKEGKCELIKGLFASDHPSKKSKYVMERIHIIGFICEEKYSNNEIAAKIRFFGNPNLITNIEEISSKLPFMIGA